MSGFLHILEDQKKDARIVNLEAENAELCKVSDKWRDLFTQAEAELAKMKRGCCANCDSCTRVGFCLSGDARVNVCTDYPMQSDFRCRYWTVRVTE